MTTSQTDSPSAKDKAQQAAGTAAEEGRHVAGTAAEEAKAVASEAAGHARGLLDEALSQVGDQSRTQKDRLASTLHTFGEDLEGMTSQGGPGLATDLAKQVAERARGLGAHLEKSDPTELLEDVRSFARRRPGTFLVGAMVAGVAAGRLLRGTADSITAAEARGSGTTYGATGGGLPSGTPAVPVPPPPMGTTPTPSAGTTNPPSPSATPGQPTIAPPLDEPGPMGGPSAGYGERGSTGPAGDRGLQ